MHFQPIPKPPTKFPTYCLKPLKQSNNNIDNQLDATITAY